MKNLFRIKVNRRMEILLIISLVIALMVYLCSCKVASKRHWLKIHPHGGWAGKTWIHGVDTIKPVVNK